MKSCIFCDFTKGSHRIIAENELVWAVLDNFPVSRGHTLIVPKRHVEYFFDLSEAEVSAAFRMIKRVREQLDAEIQPDGYNIGVNNGEAAGQTVHHVHIHLIPRHRGDVADPRGGVRNIMPNLVSYAPQA
jgi:diadenosine tetraphosphate (Ap4A) HIT family hydrolase